MLIKPNDVIIMKSYQFFLICAYIDVTNCLIGFKDIDFEEEFIQRYMDVSNIVARMKYSKKVMYKVSK